MHGGASGSGAPIGNQNARRHGRYTSEAIVERRAIRALLRESRVYKPDLTMRRPAAGSVLTPNLAGKRRRLFDDMRAHFRKWA